MFAGQCVHSIAVIRVPRPLSPCATIARVPQVSYYGAYTTHILPSHAAAVPERVVIDARAIRVAGGGSLAERPVAVGGAASPVGAGAGAVLGQGCFGTVSSMTYNGAPVAVKELSATTLDAASIGVSRQEGSCVV